MASSNSSETPTTTDDYLFSMPERDFDATIHVMTGLMDHNEHPIIRYKYNPSSHNPMGFGRDKEWKKTSALPKS